MTDQHDPVKRALVTIRELRAELDASRSRAKEPIAIVGIGTRFPGGSDRPDAFWRALSEGRDLVGRARPERWTPDGFRDHPVYPLTDEQIEAVRWGAFIDDVDAFDADFFGLSPREVRSMDPQQRILLEVVQHAVDDGNLALDRDPGSGKGDGPRVGSFVATGPQEYGLAMLGRFQDAHIGTGCAPSAASGRLGHYFGFDGPAITIDTACSSALVAAHTAVQSLRRDECDMAVVGAANLMLVPLGQYTMVQLGALSSTGRCRSFAAGADGYVRGEGAGAVLLKRLSDATADGDPIRAVILGSAVNHDGRSSGLTVPNQRAQQDVIAAALDDAGRSAADVAYVETHGTGTPLGDPIELAALEAAYGAERERPLTIGSVKTNLGHLEQAAGMVGLQKLALSIEAGSFAPHLHWDGPNPRFDWSRGTIDVATEAGPWPGERIGGLSGFGFAGTNAHLILGPGPTRADAGPRADVPADAAGIGMQDRERLLVLSAASDDALRSMARGHADVLASMSASEATLGDVASSAAAGRTHRRHRLAVVGSDPVELAGRLRRYADGDDRATDGVGRADLALRLGMLFSGQGSQRPGMGAELLDDPVFRATIDECDAVVGNRLGASLRDLLTDSVLGEARLDRTDVTQPVLFAFGVALARLWRSWGIEPDVVSGHSIGEYAAASVAGVFDLADGMELVLARGRLIAGLPAGGSMLSVLGQPSVVEDAIAEVGAPVDVAAYNGPRTVVLAGRAEDLATVATRLADEGLTTTSLAVSHAFHSRLVDPMLDEFRAVARSITFRRPDRLVVSGSLGTVVGPELTDPEYWVQHVRMPVRFDRAVSAMVAEDCRALIEIGPTSPLLGPARSTLADGEGPDDVTVIGSLHRGSSDAMGDLRRALGRLWTHGSEPDLSAAVGAERSVRLPPYPFQRRSFWFRADRSVDLAEIGPTAGTLMEPTPTGRLGNHHRSPSNEHRYERRITAGNDTDGPTVSWPVELVAMAATAAEHHTADLVDLSFPVPVAVTTEDDLLLTMLDPGRGENGLTIVSAAGEDWRRHLTATTGVSDAGGIDAERDQASGDDWIVHDVAGLDWAESLSMALDGAADGPTVIMAVDRLEVRSFGHRRMAVRSTVESSQTIVDIDWLDGAGGAVSRARGIALDTSPAADAERWVHEVRWTATVLRSNTNGATDHGSGANGRLDVAALDGRISIAGVRSGRLVPAANDGADAGDPAAIAALVDEALDAAVEDRSIEVWYRAGSGVDGALGMIGLVQALRNRSVRRLVVVTNGAVEAAHGDVPAAGAAATWAMAATIGVEYGHWDVRRLDLDFDPANADGSTAPTASAEDSGADLGETVRAVLDDPDLPAAVAWRAGRPLRPELVRRVSGPGARATIRSDRSYLVTGGLGGIGPALAAWLVDRGAGRVVLTGRSDPTAETVAALAAIDGSERILTRHLDVTDVGAVRDVVADPARDGTPLAGVFHLAGAEDGDLLADQHPRRLRQLLGPKLEGTINLDTATSDLDLDLFVGFSSASVLLPTPGLATYAAANAALEAVCARRRSGGKSATVVAWGPWAGGGMAALLATDRWLEAGVELIEPEVGVALLDRFLGSGHRSVAVLTLDPARLADRFFGARRSDAVRGEISPSTRAALATIRDVDDGERLAILDRYLQELVAVALGTDDGERLPGDRSLFELGLDSLMALEVRNRVETDLQTTVVLADFLEEPTLDHLLNTLDGRLEAGAATVPLPSVRSAEETDVDGMLAAIEHLSDAEVEAMLRSVEQPGERQ